MIVIPARYGAKRFPGKPLALIAGQTMIRRVWQSARSSRFAARVVVATDDRRIVREVRKFGGEAAMTPRRLPSGTDRVAMVARRIRLPYVVNLQGDEPLISAGTIDAVIAVLRKDRVPMATAAHPVAYRPGGRGPAEDVNDPNRVKVVVDARGRALYFSRSLLPYGRIPGAGPREAALLHVGIYGFSRSFLFRFASLRPGSLEQREGLEQLRVLENGFPIRVVQTGDPYGAVDSPADIRRVERKLKTWPNTSL